VNCAAVLETMSAGWKLDVKESTRRALKYRRGAGEIVIVNHDGRGWWDPQSPAKGDVFTLVQHLDPSLNFGEVRKVLRPLVGMAPTYPAAVRERHATDAARSPQERWTPRPRLSFGSPGWTYLSAERNLPAEVLSLAAAQDAVREGYRGSVWFAHRDGDAVGHVEVRGPDFRGSLRGGTKTLFRFGVPGAAVHRFTIAEAPIDALSLAALEGTRSDTLYAATGGGMGPGTIAAIGASLGALAGIAGAVLISATDANRAGDRFAERHAELAAAAGVAFDRLTPTSGTDWNDELRQGRGL
jgi:hypothetical protein